jgi:hypothetical protein
LSAYGTKADIGVQDISVGWAGCTIKANAEQLCEGVCLGPTNVNSDIVIRILEIKVVREQIGFNMATISYRIQVVAQDSANHTQPAITRYEPDNLRGDAGNRGIAIRIGHRQSGRLE